MLIGLGVEQPLQSNQGNARRFGFCICAKGNPEMQRRCQEVIEAAFIAPRIL